MKKLIIVGCGPKAVAIATKAHVLQGLGWTVPEIVIIDKSGVGANWDGTNGYTDGDTLLGTTPLEDVGFPYDSLIDKSVDEEMIKFSYPAYLIDTGKYAEWVDRALTAPTHRMLSEYYKWLASKVNFPLIIGEVTDISLHDAKWKVTYIEDSTQAEMLGDGLVLTGPGDSFVFPRSDALQADDDRILDGQNIWHNLHNFKDAKNIKIAVIGAGETAAGIVTALQGMIDSSSHIEIITRHPILFTRNENWFEVMYFSKVMDWQKLSTNEKKEIIHHVDRGTFSVAAKNLLDSVYNVSLKLGEAKQLDVNNDKVSVLLLNNGNESKVDYDYIIQATGFDPLSFVKLFSDKSILGDPKLIPEIIDEDISVTSISPKIHIPGLSAMSQGPGFPNLSSLGLLSDRILTAYIKKL